MLFVYATLNGLHSLFDYFIANFLTQKDPLHLLMLHLQKGGAFADGCVDELIDALREIGKWEFKSGNLKEFRRYFCRVFIVVGWDTEGALQLY